MSKLFGNLGTEGLEETQDRLGGFSALESDIYAGTIKSMYAGAAESGAQNVTVISDFGGQEYRETIYITNKRGENFFLNKNDTSKKVPLPGFTTIDHICLIATGKPLSEQDTEEKVVQIYDRDAGKEIPKTVPMLIDCLGKEVSFAILQVLENKSKKEGDKYVDTAETREINLIDKVFDTATRMTVVEALNEAEEAEFHDAWLKKNKGQVRDKRTIRDGEAGTSGRPSAAGAGARPERKSLFGNKKDA